MEAEIFHSVHTHLEPQEGAALLVHTANQVLTVAAQHMMAGIQFFEYAVQLAA